MPLGAAPTAPQTAPQTVQCFRRSGNAFQQVAQRPRLWRPRPWRRRQRSAGRAAAAGDAWRRGDRTRRCQRQAAGTAQRRALCVERCRRRRYRERQRWRRGGRSGAAARPDRRLRCNRCAAHMQASTGAGRRRGALHAHACAPPALHCMRIVPQRGCCCMLVCLQGAATLTRWQLHSCWLTALAPPAARRSCLWPAMVRACC